MNWNRLISTVLVASCGLTLHSGCQEETLPSPGLGPAFTPYRTLTSKTGHELNRPLLQPQAPPLLTSAEIPRRANGLEAPQLRFERVVHDFGQIGPATSNYCQFKFENIGDGVLKIAEVVKTCGCTPFALTKTEYAPGESGILKIGYFADTQPGASAKTLFVHSNDPATPKVTLTIKASIVTKVRCEPQVLNLVLSESNYRTQEITIASLDKKPFSITQFTSTGNCIAADFDPSMTAASFVLKPTVDVAKLERALNGHIQIGLTLPETRLVRIPYGALPRFKISPRTVTVQKAKPGNTVERKLQILSNYAEDFEIVSVSSRNGIVRVSSPRMTLSGYEFDLEITPPASNKSMFTDTLSVTMKSGQRLKIPCTGFYYEKPAPPAEPEKCPTCPDQRIRFDPEIWDDYVPPAVNLNK